VAETFLDAYTRFLIALRTIMDSASETARKPTRSNRIYLLPAYPGLLKYVSGRGAMLTDWSEILEIIVARYIL